MVCTELASPVTMVTYMPSITVVGVDVQFVPRAPPTSQHFHQWDLRSQYVCARIVILTSPLMSEFRACPVVLSSTVWLPSPVALL